MHQMYDAVGSTIDPLALCLNLFFALCVYGHAESIQKLAQSSSESVSLCALCCRCRTVTCLDHGVCSLTKYCRYPARRSVCTDWFLDRNYILLLTFIFIFFVNREDYDESGRKLLSEEKDKRKAEKDQERKEKAAARQYEKNVRSRCIVSLPTI